MTGSSFHPLSALPPFDHAVWSWTGEFDRRCASVTAHLDLDHRGLSRVGADHPRCVARRFWARDMTDEEAPLELRLHGMMQALMGAYANREVLPSVPVRSAVEEQDALDAVMQLAAAIDEFTQAGAIPPGRGVHAEAMLMVVRDYIEP